MSDTNKDRLLSDLLCQIAKADAHLTAPDEFARRVMAAWDTRDAQPPSARRWPIADGRWTAGPYRGSTRDRPKGAENDCVGGATAHRGDPGGEEIATRIGCEPRDRTPAGRATQ